MLFITQVYKKNNSLVLVNLNNVTIVNQVPDVFFSKRLIYKVYIDLFSVANTLIQL